uniref:Ankyrin repeat protein n=1 Tax=Peronospora matthiolae TaxID=2874970 RepID=A0AAV1UXA2_9STRA
MTSPLLDPPPTCSHPAASTRVLTNRSLFRYIMDFIDGVPGSVVSLVIDSQWTSQNVPWVSARGSLPRAAIQRGDLATLMHLKTLSTSRRFQSTRELVFDDRTIRCAVEFGRLEILKYLADTGMLQADTTSRRRETFIDGSKLMGWAVRYSDVLNSTSKLDIIQWVADNYSVSALAQVKTDDLSRACAPVLMYLKMRWLATKALEDPRLVDLMANMGKMDVLRVLLDREDGEMEVVRCTSDAMDGAAANGHLAVVQYLHDQRAVGCTVKAMDSAARNGYLEVVRFLHTRRTEGCTVAAMNGAARNGHLDVVQFLHGHRSEGCSTAAMDGAAAGGFLSIMQFLHENRSEGCTTKAMDGAAQSGHLEVVRYLHTQRKDGCTTDAMDGAALVGNLPIIIFLHNNRKEGCTTKAVDGAAWRGHLDVVKFLVINRAEGCTSKAIDIACQNGYLNIVRVLNEQGNALCTTAAMDAAASGGYLEIVKYLHENRVEGCTKDAMTKAAINGHSNIVRFLGEYRHEGPHGFALERVAGRGNYECVDALVRFSIRGCLFEARLAAVQAGHTRVVESLSTWMNPEVQTCSSIHYHVLPGPRWCQKQSQPEHQFEANSVKGVNESHKEEQSANGLKTSRWWPRSS